jgi:nickel transport protein
MRLLSTAAAILIAPGLASAHDFWVERGADAFVVRYGHRGGEVLAIDGAKVKAVRCADRSGAARDIPIAQLAFGPKEVKVPARCDAISAFHHGGFYSLTPDGEVNLPRNKAENAVKAWESRQFAKWVQVGSPAITRPLGDELEIVPATDLSGRKVGDKVTLKVLSQGKPVAGAIVAIDHKPLGETDSAGEARVRLRSAGVESVSASLRRSVKTPEADDLVLEASLTFEVAR